MGKMEKSIAEMSLYNEPAGTYFLRFSENGNRGWKYWITYKDAESHMIVHTQVHETNNLYHINEVDKSYTSIRRLVNAFLDTNIIKIAKRHSPNSNPPSAPSSRTASLATDDVRPQSFMDDSAEDEDESPYIPVITRDEVYRMLKEKPQKVCLCFFLLFTSLFQTYIVRKNEEGMIRISYTTRRGVKHKVVLDENDTEMDVRKSDVDRTVEFLKREGCIANKYRN